MLKEKKNLCKCGCGELVEENYKRGHARRGRKNSEEHNQKISRSNKGKNVGPSPRKGKPGRKWTEEQKKLHSLKAKEKGIGKWMKGKHHSEETKEKLRNRHVPCKQETKEKIGKANKGEKNGMFGKTHSIEIRKKISDASKRLWQKEDHRKKMKQWYESPEGQRALREGAIKSNLAISKKGFQQTKPELQMEKILQDLNISYIRQKPIRNISHRYCCDFFIESNLIIEVDGKYWHNYPEHNPLDLIRDKELLEKGYKVFRFWENEFSLEDVKKRLSDYNPAFFNFL